MITYKVDYPVVLRISNQECLKIYSHCELLRKGSSTQLYFTKEHKQTVYIAPANLKFRKFTFRTDVSLHVMVHNLKILQSFVRENK
jgi:hypothetical protein